MQVKTTLTILGLISILTVGCSPATPTSVAQSSLVETDYVGRVINASTLQPIANAKVTLDLQGVPPIVYSDNEGIYRFKLLIHSKVSAVIRVDANGYQTYTRNVTVPSEIPVEDIRLTPHIVIPTNTQLDSTATLITVLAPSSTSPVPVATEPITVSPELNVNVIKPTESDLTLVPTIQVGYMELKTPGVQPYTVNVSSKYTYLWSYVWCAKSLDLLNKSLDQMEFSFFINNIQIPESNFLIFKEPGAQQWQCQRWTTMLSNWNISQAPVLSVVFYVPRPVTDGLTTYPAGEYRHDIVLSFSDG